LPQAAAIYFNQSQKSVVMDRRELIKKVALLMGGALSAPSLLAFQRWENPLAHNFTGSDFTLTLEQRQVVAEVAEMIIPKTDTPGAKDLDVSAFVEMMIKDCYAQPEHLSFVEGVNALHDMKFLEMDAAQRTQTLKKLEADTKVAMKAREVKQTKMGDNDDKEDMKAAPKGLPFWRLMKELTLLGYFTSEEGIKASYVYVPTPGKLENIKLKPGQKAYVYS
jgi:hypothetical protein